MDAGDFACEERKLIGAWSKKTEVAREIEESVSGDVVLSVDDNGGQQWTALLIFAR
jgi:hypothetical protein